MQAINHLLASDVSNYDPSHLPVQLPTKYSLTVNLQTATDLGLELPLSIQFRADEVIE